mmetsp:Transcript_44488/g.102828  ORF Transcript_44488/g.102828 Transcript_44488/m.102828 type:complete len:262 (-) Transcript_44488:83-868(-)
MDPKGTYAPHEGCSFVASVTLCALLAVAVGLHCTLPPFLLCLLVLLDPNGPITLHDPNHIAGTWWFTATLGAVALVEFVADKVPYLDHGFHALLLVGTPAVAGLLVSVLVAPGCEGEMQRDALMVGCGALAFCTHAARGVARAHSTALTGGYASPVVSLVEDVIAVLLVMVALSLVGVAMSLPLPLVFFLIICCCCGCVGLCFCVRPLRRSSPRPAVPPAVLPVVAAAPVQPMASQAFAGAAVAMPSAPPLEALGEPLLRG